LREPLEEVAAEALELDLVVAARALQLLQLLDLGDRVIAREPLRPRGRPRRDEREEGRGGEREPRHDCFGIRAWRRRRPRGPGLIMKSVSGGMQKVSPARIPSSP